MKRREFMTLLGGSMVLPFATQSSAQAQQPPSLDAALRAAVERKDVAGVVVMAADRKHTIYQGAFGAVADPADPPSVEDRFDVPHRVDDQGDHLGRGHAADRAGPPRSR
jgi:hypothetical protein